MRTVVSRAGFTLIEITIALALMAVVGGAIALLTRSTAQAYRSLTETVQNDASARRGMHRVKEILRGTGTAQITPTLALGQWTDAIEFQQLEGQDAGVLQWSPVHRLEVRDEPTDQRDGLDNDGDGLIDERQLLWSQDVGGPGERRTILIRDLSTLLAGEAANGVDDNGNGLIDEPGACFTFESGTVRFLLGTKRIVSSREVIVTYSTQLRLLPF